MDTTDIIPEQLRTLCRKNTYVLIIAVVAIIAVLLATFVATSNEKEDINVEGDRYLVKYSTATFEDSPDVQTELIDDKTIFMKIYDYVEHTFKFDYLDWTVLVAYQGRGSFNYISQTGSIWVIFY